MRTWRRVVAACAGAVLCASSVGCSSSTPKATKAPVPTSSTPAAPTIPDKLSTDHTATVDAGLSAYEPKASLAANVAAMQATVTRTQRESVRRAVVETEKNRPVLVDCLEDTSVSGDTMAVQWRTYYTPDGVASTVSIGKSCDDLRTPASTPTSDADTATP